MALVRSNTTLRYCVLVLVVLAGARAALATSIVSTSSNVIYVDSAGNVSPNLFGNYVSFNVTNTGAAINDAWVTAGNFTGNVITLGVNENGRYHIGPLASGATRSVFFYLDVTCANVPGFQAGKCSDTTPESYTVSLFSGDPSLGSSTLLGAQIFSLTVLDTTAASANKVNSVVTTSSTALGTIVTVTTTGNTGTINATNDIFSYSPATYFDWPASVFRLQNVSITFALNGSTTTNQLLVPNANLPASASDYTEVANYLVQAPKATTTAVSPVAFIGSGTQIKHTDTSKFAASFNPIPATANPALTLTKSASPSLFSTGGTVTYTLHNVNSASSDIFLDNFQDTLPSTPAAVTYIAGSSKFAGISIADPVISGSTLTWSGSLKVPANGSADLTFTATVPSNTGTYVNSAVADVGSTVVASGNANVSVGPPDMTITKTHTGNFTQGQAGATYTITATNSGSTPTSGTVTVTDTLPSGLTAAAISGTGWSCTLGTLTCTRSDALAAGSSYPAITLTVNVANNAAASITNTAAVSGGGETNTGNDTANDATTINQLPDLTIAKSHTGNFTQGQTGATYTITAGNAGTGPTSGTVTVTDTLPSGLTATAISGTGWSCTLGTLTCTRSDALAAGSSYPAITLTVNVANNAAASLTNTAAVSGGGETNTGNDTANDTTTINQPPDLTITKTHTGNFTQGQTGATYTITASNAGTGPTSGTVTVTDTLPSGLTATAISGTGWSCTLGTLACTRSDALAAGSSYPAITLTVNVANNAAASVTNTATVSGGGETNTGNDTANDTTTINQLPDLTIAKTHTGSFTQGQTGATYTITASNAGTGPTSGTVTVTDTLPSGLTATAISGTGWSCTLGTLTCTRSDALAAGSSYPAITLTVNVASNAAASITNTAAVSGGGETNTGNDTANDTTTINQLPDLTIAKTHTGNFTQGQSGATYTITASNAGTGPTSGTVTVTDSLPSGLTATAISGTGWSCTLGTLTCTRSDALAAGSSYPAITLTVNVASNAAASITNTAAVSGGGETNTGNDTASDATTVNPLLTPDLTIAKSHTGNFTQGQTGATYTITTSNAGTGPTSGTVTVTDTLPSGLTATAISGTGWSCILGTLTCTRSDALAAGSSYPAITLTVNVANNAAASVTNTAVVSGGGETNTGNDTANDATTVNPPLTPDLAITKTHTGNFTQGQTGATYTITASNAGTGPTSGTVTVTDTLPSGLTATAISGTGWSCTLGTLTCTRSDALAAGSSYPAITLTVNVANNAAASVTNTATVSGGGETNTGNDTANDATTVNPPLTPDLAITKTHTGNFTQGQTGATYTITASNAGSGPTSGTVTVTDTLPSGLTATAISGTGWSCTLGTLTCTRSDALAAGSSYPAITLTVNVANNAAASITNTAAVSGGGETNTGNDTANDTTTINQLPDLTITKTHTGNFTQGQTGATYTITASNAGTGPTSGTVTATDTLPSGLTATAISGTGWSCTLGTLTCTRSDALAAGSSYPAITLTVNVANNAAASVTNTATVSGGGETNTGNDTANDTTTINQLPDLTITKTHTGNFTQGQTGATYTITASNAGTGPTNGTVTVTDTLPSGLTATAISGTGWSCTLGTPTCTRSDALAAGSSYPAITLTVNVANNAAASVTNSAAVSGGGETNTGNDTANDPTTVNPALTPDLTITKSHTGNFTQGQTGATYTITASNAGTGPTSGTVTVTDALPSGLTATAINGTGWSCTLGTLTCTRSDALAAGSSYPAITLTVNVANNAAASVTNSAAVSGGGEINTGNDTANDATTVNPLLTPDLTITKSHTGNFTQGQTGATYTITASNAGTGPTSGTVTVTDTLPSGLTATAISGTGWSCTLGTLTCTRSDALAAGSSYPAIALTVNVANNAAASVTNTAAVSGGGETNTGNDTANDATTVNPLLTPDLTIAKTHTGNFTQGQTGAAYTITASNAGTGPTSGTVTVTDTLPSGLTATAISGTGWSCTLGTLTCTRSDALAAGSSYPAITLTVNVANNAAASVTNTAAVSGGGETNTGNDTANDATTVNPLLTPDLTIAKSHTGNFTQGQTGAAYTITASNAGTGPTSGTVTVTDTLPSGLTATAISGTGWSCTLGTLTCTRSDALAAGSSYPAITLTVNVASNAAASITNTAAASGGGETNTGNDTANDPTTVNPQLTPDLTITKSHTGNFTQGQTGATYTITASNAGTGPTSGTVTVTDTLPSGLTATAISGTGWSCTLGTLTCTRSDALAAGSSYPAITLTVNVANNAAASVTNTAAVSGGGETNTGNDTANDATTVNPLLTPDLTITKSHTGNFTQGQTGAAYTITASNAGTGPTSGTVTVTDTLPSGLTATAISGTGWSCTLGTLTCTRSDALAAGSSYPAITLTVNVANNAAASVTNTAAVSGGGETNTGNDSAKDVTTISPALSPKLSITKTHSGNFTQGQTGAAYTITASNVGTGPTSGTVTVTDALPIGLTATAISGAGWNCTLTSLSCSRSDALAAGSSYPAITLTVNVAGNAPASLTNVATVSGGGATSTGSNTANDATTVNAAITVRPDQLPIKKNVDRSFVDTGDVPLYTLQVSNLAPVAVENAQIQDHLPNGFQFLVGSARITSNAGASASITPTVSGNDLVFTIGHLAANANVVITYRVRVAANAALGQNTNKAVLTAASGSGTITSGPATATVNVGSGIMSTRQVIVGRVFEDVNGNGLFDAGDKPIAGVRIYLSNGQSVVTDSAGLYNIPSVREGSVVVSLDPITLPPGFGLLDGGRKDGQSWTRLLRTPIGGEALLRQNFALRKMTAPAAEIAENSSQSPARTQPDAGAALVTRAPVATPSANTASGEISNPNNAVSNKTVMVAGDINNQRHLELTAEPGTIPADGRSIAVIRIRALDEHGHPLKLEHVKIRTSDGQFVSEETQIAKTNTKPAGLKDISGGNLMFVGDGSTSVMPNVGPSTSITPETAGVIPVGGALANQAAGKREALVPMSNGEATIRLVSGNTPGTVKLEAEAGDPEKPVIGRGEIYFSPEQRSAILVALGEVGIGRAAPDFAFTNQSGDFSRRADFFFRKSVLGNNLLTLGYTSDSSVNGASGINQMFQLDPLSRVYPLFGDSSTLFDAAQANSRVYGRLDHGRSYLLFGDLRGDVANNSSSNIGDYSRNLTGLKMHFENSQKDQVTVTGARPQTSFARDVFAGDTFGLIHLSHIQVLPGSEMITLETRDRRNPEVLISREPLVRSVDYTLDTNTGSIFFLRPLSTLDSALNLNQLIVSYEFENTGLSSSVYSAQGSKRFAETGTRVGASFLAERDDSIGSFYLGSMELDQVLPNKGRMHMELPVSYGTVLTAGSFFGPTDGSVSANGMAVRATLDQPFHWLKGTAHLGFSKTDDSFTNPYGATVLPGSQIARASVEVSPIGSSKLQLGFTDERNNTSLVDNQRQTASVQWKQPFGEKLDFTAGYDYRNFQDAMNPRQITSDLVSGGVDWRITSKFQASVRREQNLSNSDPTYPTQTLLSARYQINDVSRFFLTQRFSSAPIIPIGDLSHSGFTSLSSTQETSIGIETRWQQYTSLTSRYQIENGINGTDSFAVLGVVTRLPISEHFSTDLGLERGELVSGRGSSYDSSQVGLSWLPNDRYRATVRYELRSQGGLGQILSIGNAGKITDDITVLGQFTHSYAAFTGNTSPYMPTTFNSLSNATQGTAALAYRPLKSDRAGILFSYTLRQMQIAGVPNLQNDNVGLLSTDGYFQAARNLEFYGKVALSDRTAQIDDGTNVSTHTFLYQGRTQLRLSRAFDAAAEFRFINQPATDVQRWSLGNEVGYWIMPDLRVAVGYNYKSIDEYRADFLANPVRRGFYFVMSTKLSNMFNLFGTPKQGLISQK